MTPTTKTIKMELEVSTTIKKKVEITLPHYSKTNCHFFKVVSEKKSICIHEGQDSCAIEERFHTSSCFDEDNKPSNEKEFNEAYERVQSRLKSFCTD